MRPLNLSMAVFFLCMTLLQPGCGGGGGSGGGPSAGGTGSGANPGSALTFDAPASFLNGRAYETTSARVNVDGGLASPLVPNLDCSGVSNVGPASAAARINWENLTTGEVGSTSGYARCRNSWLGMGVQTFWSSGYIALAMGLNEIRFRTRQRGELVGEDVIRIRRLDGVPPEVVYTYPVEGAESVPVNRPVVVVFSEPMVAGSLAPSGLSLVEVGGAGISGTLDYHAEHQAWVLTPHADLAADSEFEIRLTGSAEDQGGGGNLGEDLIWRFRTGSGRDELAPAVVYRWPDADGCDCADATTAMKVGFGEPIDPISIRPDSATLTSAVSGQVAASLVYRGAHLELVPSAPLDLSTEYTVTLAAGIRDSAGNQLDEGSSWSFTTTDGMPAGGWQVLAPPPQQLTGASAVWTGDAWFVWGSVDAGTAECTVADACTEGVLGRGFLYDPIRNEWAPAAFEMEQYNFEFRRQMLPFPEARRAPSISWTGTEVVLFGGSFAGSGGAYDPVADTWREISSGWLDPNDQSVVTIRGIAKQATVWTGSEMILWGGQYNHVDNVINRGWRFDPERNQWRILGNSPDVDESWNLLPDTDPLAAAARVNAAAVWTGEDLIVWGGQSAAGHALDSAGRFNLATDTWQPISTQNTPPGSKGEVAAIWVGDRMLAWNGGSIARDPHGVRTVDLRTYEPAADSWHSSTAGWEPHFLQDDSLYDGDFVQGGAGRFRLVWTGTLVLAVGVERIDQNYSTEAGGWVNRVTLAVHVYDPAIDGWRTGGSVELDAGNHGLSSFATDWTGDALLVFLGASLARFTVD